MQDADQPQFVRWTRLCYDRSLPPCSRIELLIPPLKLRVILTTVTSRTPAGSWYDGSPYNQTYEPPPDLGHASATAVEGEQPQSLAPHSGAHSSLPVRPATSLLTLFSFSFVVQSGLRPSLVFFVTFEQHVFGPKALNVSQPCRWLSIV